MIQQFIFKLLARPLNECAVSFLVLLLVLLVGSLTLLKTPLDGQWHRERSAIQGMQVTVHNYNKSLQLSFLFKSFCIKVSVITGQDHRNSPVVSLNKNQINAVGTEKLLAISCYCCGCHRPRANTVFYGHWTSKD